MAARRPYMRSMEGWWRRDPFFVRYMAREMTAPFVGIYALILLAGLVSLSAGRAAYEAWVDLLGSPVSIGFHVFLAGIFVYHTFTWFAIMPKTMPPVIVGGRKVAATVITLAGIAAAALCMAILWLVLVAVA